MTPQITDNTRDEITASVNGHLSRADILAALAHLDTVKALTLAMRKQVRVPTYEEIYGSDYAVDCVRRLLLGAAVGGVEVEIMEKAT